MLFVLLWTSTLLHDFVKPDEPVAAGTSAIAARLPCVDLSTPTQNQPFQGHYHDALIESKFNSVGIPLQAALLVPLAGAHSWAGNLQTCFWSLNKRGRPHKQFPAQAKIYLLNRALLI